MRRALACLLSAALLTALPGSAAFAQVVGHVRAVTPAAGLAPAVPMTALRPAAPTLAPLTAPSFLPTASPLALPAPALRPHPLLLPQAGEGVKAASLAGVSSLPLPPAGEGGVRAAPALAALQALAGPSDPVVLAKDAEAPKSAESSSAESGKTFDGSAKLPESGDAAVPAGKTRLPRTVWGTIVGHGMLTVFGMELHVISQPFLVMEAMGQSKTTMGLVRNVHSGAFSLANLLPVGFLVDKTDFRALFIGTSLARALLMAAIPALWVSGNLTIAALLVIVAINPLFQSTMVVAERAAIMAAVGQDEKLNKEATATLTKWESFAGLFMPLLAGWALGALVTHFGLGGYAMAYGIYAAMLVLAVPLYWFMVRDPRDPKDLGLDGLKRFTAESVKFLAAIVLGVALLPWRLLKGLWAMLRKGGPAAEAPAGLKERLARWFDRHEATKGLAFVLRDKTLTLLMLVQAVESFLVEALPMVVLPNFIAEVLGPAPAGVPFFGTLLATSGGILGLMFSAEYLGRFLSSWYMEGDRGDRAIARLGGARMYRMAALSSLLVWGLWLVPTLAHGAFWLGLAAVVGAMGVMQLFHAPVGVIIAPLKRARIPDPVLGRVESAFDMVSLALASAGALLAGLVMDLTSIAWAMGLIAAAVTATAAFQWVVAGKLYPKAAHQAAVTSPATQAGGINSTPKP
jgi:hypothetical protein